VTKSVNPSDNPCVLVTSVEQVTDRTG